jgi:hypothetical protein
MTITLAIILLCAIVFVHMFFGWMIRAVIFCGFAFLSHWWLWENVPDTRHIAMTLGTNTTISWATVVPGIICILCLLITKSD